MVTKLSKLKACWAAGDKIGALRIAAKFPNLGNDKEAIELAWGCHTNPAFYAACKIDTAAAIATGLAAICQRYNLDAK